MKRKLETKRGITLISLVITIILLLILATVAISLAVDSDGLFSKAGDAANKWNSSIAEEKSIIDELIAITNRKTLGEVYTDEMIGQKLTYTANGQNEWIVFGKDKDGNILITTEKPIEVAIQFESNAKGWLNYEENLHTECAIYGGEIQGTEVTSRSITFEDINYVTGFTEPEYETYTFGTKLDYANKQLDYYYPSLDAVDTDYWKKPSVDGEATFEMNWYAYGKNPDTSELWLKYEGYDGELNLERLENLEIVIGPEEDNFYYDVASCSLRLRDSSTYGMRMTLNVGVVDWGGIWSDGYWINGWSKSSETSNNTTHNVSGLRPIVILPVYLQVIEVNGMYDLVY